VIVLWIVLGIVVLAAIFGVMSYNRFVQQKQLIKDSWANIDTELRRRYDLIPNLVEAVKGYAAHERATFEEVTQARTAAQQAQGVAEQAEAENVLTAAIGRLFAVAEAYPDLKASTNFLDLQTQLRDTEDKIAVSRQVYNDTVLTFNNAIQTFPGVVIAGPFGFSAREFFETDEAERAAPRVDFGSATGAAPAAPAEPAEPGTGGASGGTGA